jgi:outer membrane protein assembly factor BamB
VYTSIINNLNQNFTLDPSGTVVHAGGWVAMDAPTGKILWSVATPNASYPIGAVAVANGVLLTTSVGVPNGSIHALDAKTGAILWSQEIDVSASITGGVSVHGGCIFVPVGTSPATQLGFPPGTVKPGYAVDAVCVHYPF